VSEQVEHVSVQEQQAERDRAGWGERGGQIERSRIRGREIERAREREKRQESKRERAQGRK